MHRAPLPLGATGALAEEFGHAGVHLHADGEAVAVVAVGRDDLVLAGHQGGGADCDRLLTDVEVEEATHHALIVVFQGLLLEAADAEHLAEEADLLGRLKPCVDGVLGEIPL